MMRPMQFNVARSLPVAPILSAVANGGAHLTWIDGTSPTNPTSMGNPANEIGFRSLRAPLVNGGSPGAYVEVGTALANATTFTDPTYVTGQNAYYVVEAFNAAGNTQSNTFLLGPPIAPPKSPSNLTAQLAAGPIATLQFRDNATNETAFVLERSLNGGGFTTLATLPPRAGTGNVSYTDSTVVAAPGAFLHVPCFGRERRWPVRTLEHRDRHLPGSPRSADSELTSCGAHEPQHRSGSHRTGLTLPARLATRSSGQRTRRSLRTSSTPMRTPTRRRRPRMVWPGTSRTGIASAPTTSAVSQRGRT